MVLNAIKSGIFPLQITEGTGNPRMPADVSNCSHLKIVTSKKVLQRLPIPLVQAKRGNTSEKITK